MCYFFEKWLWFDLEICFFTKLIRIVGQHTKGYLHPALLMVSLEIFQTGLSFFMHILRSCTATVLDSSVSVYPLKSWAYNTRIDRVIPI